MATSMTTSMIQALHIDVHRRLNLVLLWAAIRTADAKAAALPMRLFGTSEPGSSSAQVQVACMSDEIWLHQRAAQELSLLGYELTTCWADMVDSFPLLQASPAEWEALSLILAWLGDNDVRLTYGMIPWPASDAQGLPQLLEICQRLGIRLDANRRAAVSSLALAFIGRFGLSDTTAELQVAGYAQVKDEAGEPAVSIALGTPDDTRDQVCVLSANIDDQNPEFFQHCQSRLLAAGALDVLFQPVFMKKQRPGTMLTVIGRPFDKEELVEIILAETSTLGVRYTLAERIKLNRTVKRVSVQWGEVAVKLGLRSGKLLNVAPEYEDCRRLAERNQIPVKLVYQQAVAAFWQTWDMGDSNECNHN